jgi:WD40 repeat protein
MDDQDLVAQQREAVLLFRKAGQQRQAAEREAARNLEVAEKKAADQGKVVLAQLDVGHNWLAKIQLAHLLRASAGFVLSPGGEKDPSASLEAVVSRARPAALEVETSVKDWQAYQRAMGSAERAQDRAKSAEDSALAARRSCEVAERAWEEAENTRRWRKAAAVRASAGHWKARAIESRNQANEAAAQARQAAQEAEKALSLDSGADAERAAGPAEKRAERAASEAAEHTRKAGEAADQARQLAISAADIALRARRKARMLAAAAVVLALAAAVVAIYLFVLPIPRYRAAEEAIAVEDWQLALENLEPLAQRPIPYRDSRALLVDAYRMLAESSMEAEDWPAAAAAIAALNRVDYNYGNTLDLAASRPALAAELAAQNSQAWQSGKAKRLATLTDIRPSYLAFSPDGRWLASPVTSAAGQMMADVALRRVPDGRTERVLAGLGQVASALSFSPDSKLLGGYSPNKEVRVWDTETGEALGAFAIGYQMQHIAFSADGEHMALSDGALAIRAVTIADPALQSLPFIGTRVNRITFSTDGSQLIAETDKVAYWWQVTDWSASQVWVDNSNYKVATSGRHLVANVTGTELRIWDGSDWARYELEFRPDDFLLTPDGDLLVLAGPGGRVQVWRTSGQLLHSLQCTSPGGRGCNATLNALSSDGTILALGSQDGWVTLLRLDTGTMLVQLKPLQAGEDYLRDLEFVGPGGALLAVVHGRGVSFWQPQSMLEEQ